MAKRVEEKLVKSESRMSRNEIEFSVAIWVLIVSGFPFILVILLVPGKESSRFLISSDAT